MKFNILIIPLLLFNAHVRGQDTNQIDVRLKACLDSSQNYTTVGMNHCIYCAEMAWDAEMNRYYKLLQEVLSTQAKIQLKTSQINWLSFRDSEFKTINIIYDLQGTMWSNVRADARMELIKQRALVLKEYYDTLTEH